MRITLSLSTVLAFAVISTTGCDGDNKTHVPTYTNSYQTSGSSNNTSTPVRVKPTNSLPFGNAEDFEHRCDNPRIGRSEYTDERFPDQNGTQEDELNWVRAWINKYYLWYDEVDYLNPDNFTDPANYFDRLKTFEKTASGKDKDEFHFTRTTEDTESYYIGGSSLSLGIEWNIDVNSISRTIRVSFVEPDAPASRSIQRGDTLLEFELDGRTVDASQASSSSDIDALIKILSSDFESVATLTFADTDNNRYDVDLSPTEVEAQPVLYSDIIDTATSRIGYAVFTAHTEAAQNQLIDAIEDFDSANVDDVIIDLRYNGGGYLYIASQLGYMLAGAQRTAGKTFELLQFNDRFSNENPFSGEALEPYPFFNQSRENAFLPTLNLNRVFVITTDDTCSASEAVINGLRGIDVEVIQIGETTCGKPYGFYGVDNCGTTYYAVNFSGINDKGFGDFADGFTPSSVDDNETRIKGCRVSDDLDNPLGSTREAMLDTALHYIDNDECPSQGFSGKESTPPLARKSATKFEMPAFDKIKPNYKKIKLLKQP